MSGALAGRGVIWSSFLIGLLLAIIPLPDWAQHLRPQWVALLLVYWCMMLPHRVSIGTAWLLGLLMDVLTGTLLGQQALAYALIAFVAVRIHQRLRVFPLWQQSLIVFALLLVERVISLWIMGAVGQPAPGLEFWLPAIIGLMLWPWLYIVLRDLQQRLRLH